MKTTRLLFFISAAILYSLASITHPIEYTKMMDHVFKITQGLVHIIIFEKLTINYLTTPGEKNLFYRYFRIQTTPSLSNVSLKTLTLTLVGIFVVTYIWSVIVDPSIFFGSLITIGFGIVGGRREAQKT